MDKHAGKWQRDASFIHHLLGGKRSITVEAFEEEIFIQVLAVNFPNVGVR